MFLVFAYADYYPRGGWNDLIGVAQTFYEAKELLRIRIEGEGARRGHIVDLDTKTVFDDSDIFEGKEWSEEFKKWLTWEEEEELLRLGQTNAPPPP